MYVLVVKKHAKTPLLQTEAAFYRTIRFLFSGGYVAADLIK